MIQLAFGGLTDTGNVRAANQDELLIADPIFAVADGMGGHQGGEVASKTAMVTLEETFKLASPGNERSVEDLVKAVVAANKAVWGLAQKDSNLHGMGTTLTAVARVRQDGEERLAVANVGDSRGYLLRYGELTQLTSDHSLVGEMVQAGQLTPEQAEQHPRRNILTKALGVDEEVEPDVWQITPQPGDRILLCSDGLVREVGDSQIASTLRRLADPSEAAQALVSQAKTNGGSDNITVVIIDVVDEAGAGEGAATEHERLAETASYRKTDDDDDDVEHEHRLITIRVVAFIAVLVLLAGAVIFAIGYYARASYFVATTNGQIAIFKGRPDGVLWFKPTLVEKTGLTTDDVLPGRLDDLEEGRPYTSVKAARTYATRLAQEARRVRSGVEGATPPATTATTTSTIPTGQPATPSATTQVIQ